MHIKRPAIGIHALVIKWWVFRMCFCCCERTLGFMSGLERTARHHVCRTAIDHASVGRRSARTLSSHPILPGNQSREQLKPNAATKSRCTGLRPPHNQDHVSSVALRSHNLRHKETPRWRGEHPETQEKRSTRPEIARGTQEPPTHLPPSWSPLCDSHHKTAALVDGARAHSWRAPQGRTRSGAHNDAMTADVSGQDAVPFHQQHALPKD